MPVRVRPPAPKYPSIYLSSLDRLADIYQIAKNCRTSVEMIEKYYAAHIKNTLDTSAINRRRPRRKGEVQAPDLDTDE